MVALLQPTARPTAARQPAARRTSGAASHLRLVETPARRTSILEATDAASVVAILAVMGVMLLVVLVRSVQGAPPADDWAGLADASAPSIITAAGPSTHPQTVTVTEGDTWATIAARIAPDLDPVEVARSLASANGGYRLEAGQVLVVAVGG